MFVCKRDGNAEDIAFHKEEIDQVKWLDLSELEKQVLEFNNPDWSYMGYEDKLIPFIHKQLNKF